MTAIIAHLIIAAVIAADIAVSYAIGKATCRFISSIMHIIRNRFR